MDEHKTIVDSDGFIIERCVLFYNRLAQDFILEDGQQALDFYSGNYVKPRWNGNEWIETATENEIAEARALIEARANE